jgi:hypothetical protein
MRKTLVKHIDAQIELAAEWIVLRHAREQAVLIDGLARDERAGGRIECRLRLIDIVEVVVDLHERIEAAEGLIDGRVRRSHIVDCATAVAGAND